jgi:hypothetical protein
MPWRVGKPHAAQGPARETREAWKGCENRKARQAWEQALPEGAPRFFLEVKP